MRMTPQSHLFRRYRLCPGSAAGGTPSLPLEGVRWQVVPRSVSEPERLLMTIRQPCTACAILHVVSAELHDSRDDRYTSDVDLSLQAREANAVRQVQQLRHATCNAVVYRFSGRIALNNAARTQQDRGLDRLQGDVAWIEETCASPGVLYTSSTRTDTGEKFVG